jgi:CRP-like cAMP-binding protein
MGLDSFLQKIEVFQGLKERELTSLDPCCQEKSYRQNNKLFGEDEEAACLWAVKKGEVDLRFDLPGRDTSDETTIATITEGKCFGWSGMVPPYKYRLSAYCVSRTCQVILISREKLFQLFERDPRIGYVVMTNIATVIGTRFQKLQEEMIIREGLDIRQRRDF